MQNCRSSSVIDICEVSLFVFNNKTKCQQKTARFPSPMLGANRQSNLHRSTSKWIDNFSDCSTSMSRKVCNWKFYAFCDWTCSESNRFRLLMLWLIRSSNLQNKLSLIGSQTPACFLFPENLLRLNRSSMHKQQRLPVSRGNKLNFSFFYLFPACCLVDS